MNIYVPNQNDIIHETSVDFVLRPCAKEVHIVQYDKSLPIVKVELFRNGERYVLPENAAVNVRVGKLDHTFVYDSILGTNEERNIVYFEISEQMATISGRIWPVLEVIENSKVACSSPIHMIIERNPIQEGQIESHDDFPIIYELQGTVADHESRISALENQTDGVVTLHTNQYDIDGEKGFTSNVSVGENGSLSLLFTPTLNSHAVTKGYVDGNDQILANNICAPYDNTATYEVDDIAIYNNQLIRCTVAITEPEEFNAEHWTTSTIKYNFVTKNGDQRITGDIVFDGNITFNGGLAYTGTGSIIMNPSYLGLNNSEIQTNNTSVEIGAGTNKTYINRLPSTFYSTVGLKGNTTVEADLKFGNQMTINKDGNFYFANGTAWSVNIDNNKKIRYAKDSGQLDLRYGDFRLTNGNHIFWGSVTDNSIYGNAGNLYFSISNSLKLLLTTTFADFHCAIRMYSMGTGDYAVPNKKYVDDSIASAVSSVYKYKGSVATYNDLPSTGLTVGDVYNIEDTGDNYAWTGSVWDKLAGTVDLSIYYTITQTDNLLSNKVDKSGDKEINGPTTFKGAVNLDSLAYSNYGEFRFNNHLYFTDNTEQHNNILQLFNNDIIAWKTLTCKSALNVDGLIYAGGHEIRFNNDYLNFTDNTDNHNTIVQIHKDYVNTLKQATFLSNIKISAQNDTNPPIMQTTFDREGGWVNFGRGATFNASAEFNGLIWAGGREIRFPDYVEFKDNTQQHNTVLKIDTNFINAEKIITAKQGINIDVQPTESQHAVRKDYVDNLLSNKEDKLNKVTSLSISSTDTQYPSAKCVYTELASKYTKPSTGIPASDLTPGSSGQVLYTDSNGNVIWKTVSGTGSVTSITAGTGLTTTLDSMTDGGSITTSGILYLTKVLSQGATKCKITYDVYGRVTAGADLTASDIPSLDASKITSGTFSDDKIASASTWNAKYGGHKIKFEIRNSSGISSARMTIKARLWFANGSFQAVNIEDVDDYIHEYYNVILVVIYQFTYNTTDSPSLFQNGYFIRLDTGVEIDVALTTTQVGLLVLADSTIGGVLE